MSPENTLKLTTAVDLAGFQSGIPAAAALVENGVQGMGESAKEAAKQFSLFGEEMAIPWADAAGQMNMFSGALEPIAEAAASAADGLEKLGPAVDGATKHAAAAKDVWDKLFEGISHPFNEGNWKEFGEGVESLLAHPLRSAGAAAKDFLNDIGPVGALAAVAAAGLYEFGKEAFGMVEQLGHAVRANENLSLRLGMTGEETKKLGEMARLVDTDIGSLARAAMKLSDTLEHPGSKASDELRKLGVTATETGPALLQTLEKLSQIEDSTKRMAEARKMLGRAAISMQPVIADYKQLHHAIEELGGQLSGPAVDAMLAANQQINELDIAWEHLKDSMTAKLAPTVTVIITAIKNALTPDEGTPKSRVQSAREEVAAAHSHAGPSMAGWDKVTKSAGEVPKRLLDAFMGGMDSMSNRAGTLQGQLEQADKDRITRAETNLRAAIEEEKTAAAKIIADKAAADKKALSDKAFGASFDKSLEGKKEALTKNKEEDKTAVETKDLAKHNTLLKEQLKLELEIKAMEKAKSGANVAERNAITEKQIENNKKLGLEMVTAAEAVAKQKLHTGAYTIEQETEALRAAERTRYAIEVDAAKRSDALKAQTAHAEHKPKPVATDQRILLASHQARDTSIVTQGANKAEAQQEANAQATIKSIQSVDEARVAAQAQAVKEAYNLRQISIAQETAAQEDEENQLNGIRKTALAAELALAEQDPEKNGSKIIGLHSQIQTLEIKHQSKLTAIKADGAKRSRDEVIAITEATESADSASAARVYQFSRDRIEEGFKMHEIDAVQRIRLLREIEAQEYKTQLAGAEGKRDDAVAVHGTGSSQAISAQANVDSVKGKHDAVTAKLKQEAKMAMTDLQMVYKSGMDKVVNSFSSGFDQMLTRQKSFAAAMTGSFRSMADQMIVSIVKASSQLIAQAALEKLIGKQVIHSQAAQAAAKVWNSFAWTPLGVIEGGILAAATFAAIEAFGSFEYGGVVPSTGMKLLHEGERVLTPRDNQSFERAINGSAGGSGGTVNNYHAAAGESPDSVTRNAAAFKRAMRDGALRFN